jgi:prepilin signal peptidase PulO-like enzyme (type II secretory pathway)
MATYSHLEKARKGEPFVAPNLSDLAFATLGSLAAFIVLGFQVGLLVAGWWCLSLVIVKSDLEDLIIPNWATAGIGIFGITYVAVDASSVSPHWSNIANAVLVAIERASLTFLGVAAFAFVFKSIIGRECLGFGDVKLSGALAVWLGAYDLLITVELACFAALALVGVAYLRDRESPPNGVIPFGAFLAPAGWFVYLGRAICMGSGSWHSLLNR